MVNEAPNEARRFLTPTAIGLVVLASLPLYALGFHAGVVVILCCLTIVCFFYNMVWLYRRTENYMEDIPSNIIYYGSGATSFSLGIALLGQGFLTGNLQLRQIGVAVCLAGLLLIVFATRKLFDRIAKGKLG